MRTVAWKVQVLRRLCKPHFVQAVLGIKGQRLWRDATSRQKRARTSLRLPSFGSSPSRPIVANRLDRFVEVPAYSFRGSAIGPSRVRRVPGPPLRRARVPLTRSDNPCNSCRLPHRVLTRRGTSGHDRSRGFDRKGGSTGIPPRSKQARINEQVPGTLPLSRSRVSVAWATRPRRSTPTTTTKWLKCPG